MPTTILNVLVLRNIRHRKQSVVGGCRRPRGTLSRHVGRHVETVIITRLIDVAPAGILHVVGSLCVGRHEGEGAAGILERDDATLVGLNVRCRQIAIGLRTRERCCHAQRAVVVSHDEVALATLDDKHLAEQILPDGHYRRIAAVVAESILGAVAPDVFCQSRIVDKRIAVVLNGAHRFVAGSLNLAHRVLSAPLQQQP